MSKKAADAPAPAQDQPTLSPSAALGKTTAEGRDWPEGLPTVLPAQLGHYQLLKLLGKGGMGAVYLARDTVLDRDVALKIPLFSAANEAMRERFFREARAAAKVSHPNICPVYHIGEIEGVCYLEMELIKGKPLSDFIGQPLPERTVILLVRQVALALQAAHQHGIIHRDLKPANIMINTRKQPVIMDFGLAHLATAPSDKSRLTRVGTVMGTPAYMPPEQLHGDVQAMGPGCDVYSLGIVLYELLTGKVPFKGSLDALMSEVLRQPPLPPHTFRSHLNPTLEAICLKALEKKPEDRYRSMKDFVAALDECLRGKALAATTPYLPSGLAEPLAPEATTASPKPSAFRRAVSKPILAGAGGLLVLACAAALTLWLWRFFSSEPSQGSPVQTSLPEPVERRASPATPVPAPPRVIRFGELGSYVDTPVPEPVARVELPPPPPPPPPPAELPLMTFKGHKGAVNSVCPSTDGTWLASAGDDNSVRIWDVKTGRQKALLKHDGPVLDVTVDLVMKRVASATAKQVSVWDVQTEKLKWTRPAPPKVIPLSLCYSGDSANLMVYTGTGWIRAWKAANGSAQEKRISEKPVKSTCMDQHSRYVATARVDGNLCLRELGKRPVLFRDLCPADVINFSPAGKHLASAGADGRVHLWSVPAPKEVATGQVRRSPVRCLAFSFKDHFNQAGNEGRWLVSSHADGAITVWEVLTEGEEVSLQERVTYDAHVGGATCALFTPDNRSVLSCGRDGEIKLWAVPPH